jgi:hypothetical protein
MLFILSPFTTAVTKTREVNPANWINDPSVVRLIELTTAAVFVVLVVLLVSLDVD